MQTGKEELTAFTEQWDNAMLSNDAGEIAKFLSEDWVIIGTDGTTSKASFLQFISSGALTHSRMDSDELLIRIYGDTGIIVSRGTSAGQYNGEDFSLYEWSTSVCVKKDEKWLCVLTMLTMAKRPGGGSE